MGLSFAGGCALPALTFAPVIWSRRGLLLGGAAAGIAGLLVSMGKLNMPSAIAPDHRNVLGLEMALFIAGGIGALALAFADWRRSRDANSVLLLLWVLGTWVFASFVNWIVNARSVGTDDSGGKAPFCWRGDWKRPARSQESCGWRRWLRRWSCPQRSPCG